MKYAQHFSATPASLEASARKGHLHEVVHLDHEEERALAQTVVDRDRDVGGRRHWCHLGAARPLVHKLVRHVEVPHATVETHLGKRW